MPSPTGPTAGAPCLRVVRIIARLRSFVRLRIHQTPYSPTLKSVRETLGYPPATCCQEIDQHRDRRSQDHDQHRRKHQRTPAGTHLHAACRASSSASASPQRICAACACSTSAMLTPSWFDWIRIATKLFRSGIRNALPSAASPHPSLCRPESPLPSAGTQPSGD